MTPLSRRAYLVALAVIFLLALAFLIDQPIVRTMARIDPGFIALCRTISWFGEGGVILIPAGMMVLAGMALGRLGVAGLDEFVKRTASVFAVVAGAGLLNDLLKIVFGRARPPLWLAGDETGFGFFRLGAKFASFPSGHTATSVAAALALSALFPRWRWLFAGFAILVGLSRIGVGAHYPSDVVGGAAIGFMSAAWMTPRLRRAGWMPALTPGLRTWPY